jgi:hypothetical protein
MFLGETSGGLEDRDRALEGSASKRCPPDPLEEGDGLVVADEMSSNSVLGRLCIQATLDQQAERPGMQPAPGRGPEVVIEGLAKERMGELDPCARCRANQAAAIESIECDIGLALVQVGQAYRQIRAKAGPQDGRGLGTTQTGGR